MSKIYFYSHLVEIDTITEKLDLLELSEEEKINLGQLVDANIHHTILNALLEELSLEDKKIFMDKISGEDHDEIWQFLNERIEGVEDKIKKSAQEIKQEMHEDIEEAKKKSSSAKASEDKKGGT